jgi:hypothetical protein
MWQNSALTTTANAPAQYYAKESALEPIITRDWSPFSLESGGGFGSYPTACGVDPEPTTRYRVFLKYSSSVLNICESGSSTTLWADNQDFEQATTLYTAETGTTIAGEGYYVIDSTRAIVQPGDTNSYKVRRLRFGSLTNTTTNCNTGSDFDGEEWNP